MQSWEDLGLCLIWISKLTLFSVKAKYLSLAAITQTNNLSNKKSNKSIKDQCHSRQDGLLIWKLMRGNEAVWEKTKCTSECIQIHPAPLWSYPKDKQGKKRKERKTERGHMVCGAPWRILMGIGRYKYVNKHQGLVYVTCKTSQSISVSPTKNTPPKYWP